ncbi:MAG TPA: class I SAM-dependent methyltransferase [Sphingomicrobium sp.]|nr:class I SAM-dependent methyltransferase [Sphingomicrobium sp.]
MSDAALSHFGAEYARHRESEGRDYSGDDLLALPYLRNGPLAHQWAVRARSFEAFLGRVVGPETARLGRPLTILDLGAGNGWLSYRLALLGHRTVALDIRADSVDGLGAAEALVQRASAKMECVRASFDAIPIEPDSVDIALFNASLHYSTDLEHTLGQAVQTVRRGGKVVVLDSPFYRRERDGLAMVTEKKAQADLQFGQRADALLALPFVEFLTRERLNAASAELNLRWRRRRVRYPLWYELRPIRAALLRQRAPSRFDLWIGERQ